MARRRTLAEREEAWVAETTWSRGSGERGGERSGERKPYSRPRILSREALEAVAAVCAPSPPAKQNPGVCPAGPISS